MSLRQGSFLATSQYNLPFKVICFLHSDSAMYSDSAEGIAVIVCVLVLHTLGAPLIVIKKPVVDLCVPLDPPQSVSTQTAIEYGLIVWRIEDISDLTYRSLRRTAGRVLLETCGFWLVHGGA